MDSFTVGPPFPRLTPLPIPRREDYWNEDTTLTLLDAWGEYYLVLNRGVLRQEHWQEVANTVNNRNGRNFTDIQCKNRMDTLKKRYKNEKARVSDSGDYIGTWPYFHQLDSLIWDQYLADELLPPAFSNNSRKTRSMKSPAWTQVPVRRRSNTQRRPRLMPGWLSDMSPDGKEDSLGTVVAGADSGENSKGEVRSNGSEKRKRGSEIVEAIERFGEIYERVELEKQKQMVELEKERMQFIKDLEFQRMQLLFDMHVQMQPNKRS